MLIHNTTWEQLEQLDTELEGARLIFLDGAIEVLPPTTEAHEEAKSTIRGLVEAFLRVKGLRFYIRGRLTLGSKEVNARIEPDASYSIAEKKPLPDLAIVVSAQPTAIDRLAIYARLRVPEVWIWTEGAIGIHCLIDGAYQQTHSSRLLPDLDVGLLEAHAGMADQYDAIRAFTIAVQ